MIDPRHAHPRGRDDVIEPDHSADQRPGDGQQRHADIQPATMAWYRFSRNPSARGRIALIVHHAFSSRRSFAPLIACTVTPIRPAPIVDFRQPPLCHRASGIPVRHRQCRARHFQSGALRLPRFRSMPCRLACSASAVPFGDHSRSGPLPISAAAPRFIIMRFDRHRAGHSAIGHGTGHHRGPVAEPDQRDDRHHAAVVDLAHQADLFASSRTLNGTKTIHRGGRRSPAPAISTLCSENCCPTACRPFRSRFRWMPALSSCSERRCQLPRARRSAADAGSRHHGQSTGSEYLPDRSGGKR